MRRPRASGAPAMGAPGRRPRWRRRRDAGHAAVEFVAALGLVVAPVVALAVTLPGWAQARLAAEAAAVEAARLAASVSDPPAATERAEEQARQVLANHDVRGPAHVDVTVPADRDGGPVRDGSATVEVAVTLRLRSLPAVGEVGGFPITASHTEPLDPWRGFDPDG